MAPRAKRRSLCKQQLDRIFRAVVIGHNEPSTQNRSAAIDPTKAMKQNVHGLVFVNGNDWLLPQLEAYISICVSSWRGISFAMLRAVRSRGPAASLWCHPADNEYELQRAHRNNPSNSMELHVHSFQSHTWKQPLSQTRRDLLWWHPSCKRPASCQAA